MVKIVRIPLTDAYGRDFMTGEVVKIQEPEQSEGQQERVERWLKSKRSEAETLGLDKGYIKVEGLGIIKY